MLQHHFQNTSNWGTSAVHILHFQPRGGSVSLCGGCWAPRSGGNCNIYPPLTSPLLLTKCTERFRGILIRLMWISSPYLPFNLMTVIWQKGENNLDAIANIQSTRGWCLVSDACLQRWSVMPKFYSYSLHILYMQRLKNIVHMTEIF